MDFTKILLIIISSAGLLHGILLALYLTFFTKKKSLSNLLLSLILIAMGYRIGKSVILNFADHLELQFIFSGLAVLFLIGPLCRWYVGSMVLPQFKLIKTNLLEILPFLGVLISIFFVSNNWLKNNDFSIYLFAGLLGFSYLHFVFYIFLSWWMVKYVKKENLANNPTKNQEAILKWLSTLILGFSIIWISYVLNILDDSIPYIIGPVIYSLGIYYLSFKGFNLKIYTLDGSAFKIEKNESTIYNELVKLIEQEKLFLSPDLTLEKLGKSIGLTSQKTSAIINMYANRNFNDFINYYRIQEAKILLTNPVNNKLTISSMAYDVGFNSMSSFNTAFKKFENTTPSNYKKTQI